MIDIDKLDEFTRQYLETALWSSTDILENGEMGSPLDENYGIEDFDDDTLESLITDCEAFQVENWDMISSNLGQAGHDFWLTRNRHGAGFWDGDWPEEIGKILTDRSHVYGSVDLYSHEGKVYT